MKVFFGASPRADEKLISNYRKIVTHILEQNYTLTNQAIIESILKNKIEMSSKDYYKEQTKALEASNICIFEGTLHSSGIGFAVQRALSLGKSTCVLYYKDNVPFFLSGAEHEQLILKSYKDSNIIKVLGQTLERAKEVRDKRFNFFVSPKIIEYIEKKSEEKHLTKSQLLRNIILDYMQEDPLE